jgi:hypothetical protein
LALAGHEVNPDLFHATALAIEHNGQFPRQFLLYTPKPRLTTIGVPASTAAFYAIQFQP